MYNINEIMVCLDNTPTDDYLIDYIHMLSSALNSRCIYFVHVTDKEEKHHHTLASKIESAVNERFKDSNLESKTIILTGNVTSELISFASDKDVELIILGKKKNHKKQGNTVEKLTKKAPCSLTVVQENKEMKIENILLPVDFSSYSKMALEEAREVKKNLSQAKLCSLTLYDVPSGYYKSGKNYDEAAEIMKKNKEDLYWKYIRKIKADDLAIEPHFKFKGKNNDAQAIYDFAIDNNTDLIIIGARGKTKASLFLMGSTTGELLKLNDKIPTMVLKKKGYQFDFLKALRKI